MKSLSEMTPTELRIACAERMGWQNTLSSKVIAIAILENDIPPNSIYKNIATGEYKHNLPDYEHDMNALRELILAVPEDKQNKFVRTLENILFDRDLPAIVLNWAYKMMITDPVAIMRAFLTIMEEKE